MASITIISGGLGAGKTTLSSALAHAAPAGLHLITDVFYTFPAYPVDPTTEEAHTQNTTIIKAIGRAAAAFAEGGYDVVLDGVVGPWFLPTLLGEWPHPIDVAYVILQARLDVALARVLGRDGTATQTQVRHMHEAFADLGSYPGHVIETSDQLPEAVCAAFIQRRRTGAFMVDRNTVGS